MTYTWYVGVDLAQAFDYTAIAVCEEGVWIGGGPATVEESLMWPQDEGGGWVSPSRLLPVRAEFFRKRTRFGDRPSKPPLYLRHLERMRGTNYGVITARIAEVVGRLPCPRREVALVVDRTGVGRAIHDRLYEYGLRPIGVTLTGGNNVNPAPGGLSTPKRELVAACQSALQEGRLRIAAGLEHAPTLVQELKDFRVRISASGHDTYDARPGSHDDLVISASLAMWYRDYWERNYDIRNEKRKVGTR